MRLGLLRRTGFALCVLGTACSLQFDNPEQETEQKISQVYPMSFSALSGRWVADSTYTPTDTRATQLGDQNVLLEFRPDSTFWTQDSAGLVFAAPHDGTFQLTGDSLSLHPGSASAYPALATLRFLGDYLEIYLPKQQRYAEFHKVKAPDTLNVAGWLGRQLWLVTARQPSFGTAVPESLRAVFTYAIFHGDSLLWQRNNHGLPSGDTEVFSLDTNTFGYGLAATGSGSSWLLQWVQPDTLRLWPMRNGRLDSGFLQCARTAKPHPFDLNCAFLTRYWRGDSLYREGQWSAFHYGYFFDLGFDTAHRTSATTDVPDLPHYRSWDIDSGRLILKDSLSTRAFVVDSAGPTRFFIHSVTTPPDTASLQFRFTTVDSALVNTDPIMRFTNAPYARIAVGGDTLAYYWYDDFERTVASLDRYELFGFFGSDTLSLITQWPEGLQTYSTALSNFRFEFAGRTAALGRFLCSADSSTAFALRLLASSDPTLVPGNFQGGCKVLQAELPASLPTDSNLTISGDFRFVSVMPYPLKSPLWQP